MFEADNLNKQRSRSDKMASRLWQVRLEAERLARVQRFAEITYQRKIVEKEEITRISIWISQQTKLSQRRSPIRCANSEVPERRCATQYFTRVMISVYVSTHLCCLGRSRPHLIWRSRVTSFWVSRPIGKTRGIETPAILITWLFAISNSTLSLIHI